MPKTEEELKKQEEELKAREEELRKKEEEFKKQQEAFAVMNGGQNPQNQEKPEKKEEPSVNAPSSETGQKEGPKQPDPQPAPKEPEVPEPTRIYDQVQAQFEADNKKLTEEDVFKGITSGSFFEENQRRMSEQFRNPEAHEKTLKSGWRKDSLNYTKEELQQEFDKADKSFSGRSIIDSTEEKPFGKRYKDVHQEALEARKIIQELAKKDPEELQTKEVRAQLKNCFAKIALDDIIRRERSIRAADIVGGKQVPGPVEKTLNQHKNAYEDFIKGLETSKTIEERVHEIGRPDAVIKPNKLADFLINKDAEGLSFGLYHESREVMKDQKMLKQNILEGLGEYSETHAKTIAEEEAKLKEQQYKDKVAENKKGLETQEKIFNDELKYFRDQSDFSMGF